MAGSSLATRKAEYDKVVAAAEELQKKYAGKKWDPAEREKFEALCVEGDEMGKDIDAEIKFEQIHARGRQLRDVPERTLPSRTSHAGEKSTNAREIAGFITVGDAVLAHQEFKAFAGTKYATGQSATVQLRAAILGHKNYSGPSGEAMIALTRDERQAYEEWLNTGEGKAIPTIGSGIIEPERIGRIPQQTADDRLRVRDILSTGQTGAGSIEYVREDTFTPASTVVAAGSTKPEEAMAWSRQTAPVRTIAGWIPVQNQQLEDWPQLRSMIDGRLRYSVQRTEEQEIFYGDGTGEHIDGLLHVAGTQNIAANGRTLVGDTLIDIIRRGITDVFVAGYEANAVALHPFDWETILLEKGTDNRYVWAVVTDNNGSRIWGVRVVESVGLQSRAPADVPRRCLVVGDYRMGAQLLDRMDLTVQVGLVNDQFIKNMRTILAEERIAFPVYAPAAFAFYQTQEES